MRKNLFRIVVAGALISGCASTPTPQNPQEFRNGVTQGVHGSLFETFVVNRPYKDVAGIVKAKTNACLNAKIDRQSCSGGGSGVNYRAVTCSDSTDQYNATVVDGASKTEVHVQFGRSGERTGNIFLGGPPPAGGMYITVADITPAGNGKTKIDIYRTTFFKAVPNAIKQWSDGTNQGCPTFKEF